MPPTHAVAVTSDGYSLRFGFDGVRRAEHARRPALRAAGRGRRGGGRREDRRRARPSSRRPPRRGRCCARSTRSTTCPGPARASSSSSCKPDEDRVLGFIASTGDRDLLTVETSRGAEQTISTTKYEVTEPRRQGARTAAARPVHAHRAARISPRRRAREPARGPRAAGIDGLTARAGVTGDACATSRSRRRVDVAGAAPVPPAQAATARPASRLCARRTGTSACRRGG